MSTDLFRAELVSTNDSGKLQRARALGYAGEELDDVHVVRQHGFSSVAPVGSHGIGLALRGMRGLVALLGLELPGKRSKNLRPGESAHHDDQGQISKLARDGLWSTMKKLTFTAGKKPDLKDHELNEQLKGLAARVAQDSHQIHALFNATSRLRELVQARVPEVAALANILNKEVSGLQAMVDDLSPDKAKELLQKTAEQALGKFLNPNLAGLQSLLSGNLEAAISGLQQQIADTIAQNPVVEMVDDLVDELAGLAASEAEASVIAAGTARLTGEITRLTAANPIVGAVATLRGSLQTLLDQAGPALNFLAGQKRLVEGKTKSLRLGGPG